MKYKFFLRGIVAASMLASVTLFTGCGDNELSVDKTGKWPAGKSPVEIGRRAANYSVRHHMGRCDYETFCAAFGILKYAGQVGDKELINCVIAGYGPYLFDGRSPWRDNGVVAAHQWFGLIPFELYNLTGEQVYLKEGRKRADEQFAKARPDGLPGYTRFWADDVYGAPTMQGLASKHLGEKKYADRGILQVLEHAKRLQQDSGLFFHTEKARHHWGRANGWAAAGMAELLMGIPEDHPKRDQVMDVYKKMMAGLLKYQDENGMWHQLIDYPDAWPETSCTAMFVFAIATSVEQGWLTADTYKQAAKKGWIALAGYLDSEDRLGEVCVGTGEESPESYLARPREVANAHGQAPLIWAASAMIKMEK